MSGFSFERAVEATTSYFISDVQIVLRVTFHTEVLSLFRNVSYVCNSLFCSSSAFSWSFNRHSTKETGPVFEAVNQHLENHCLAFWVWPLTANLNYIFYSPFVLSLKWSITLPLRAIWTFWPIPNAPQPRHVIT